jgi:hypothetical protein
VVAVVARVRRVHPVLLTACAVALTVGCADRVERVTGIPVLGYFQSANLDSIRLTYICANRFRVRNYNDVEVAARWDVYRTSDSGRVTLPPRAGGSAYAEVFFETAVRGTTRLFVGSTLVQTKANGGTVCPATVPGTAPDTFPFELVDSLPKLDVNGDSTVLVVSRLLSLEFRNDATSSQRASAIGAVGGTVVGGVGNSPGEEGTYYILVPSGTTLRQLLDLADQLMRLPGVDVATVVPVKMEPPYAHRLPREAPTGGWDRFSVRPADAGGLNGALEMARAPAAWGCAVGSHSVRIGVLDADFFIGEDLAPNVDSSSSRLSPGIPGRPHGTNVAAILGAVGDNGLGITGMMWRVRMTLHDWRADPARGGQPAQVPDRFTNEVLHLRRLAESGVSAINFSLTGQSLGGSAEDQPRLFRQRAVRLARALVQARRVGRFPLFVVAAGNADADAATFGFDSLRARLGSQLVVVGGIRIDGTRWTADGRFGGSNFGPLIDIWARSDSVGTLDADGRQGYAPPGTSFAAPLVTGAIGLLLAFDSRLGTSTLAGAVEVRSLLLAGARPGAAGPILDAYGALRRAAQSTGRPLCGNLVWPEGSVLKAQRGAVVEDLATLKPQPGTFITCT